MVTFEIVAHMSEPLVILAITVYVHLVQFRKLYVIIYRTLKKMLLFCFHRFAHFYIFFKQQRKNY